jgi:hypothetical protein
MIQLVNVHVIELTLIMIKCYLQPKYLFKSIFYLLNRVRLLILIEFEMTNHFMEPKEMGWEMLCSLNKVVLEML